MKVKKDQMTSNERMQAYFDGKEVDRLPAMPMIDSVGPRLVGKETRFMKSGKKYSEIFLTVRIPLTVT